MSQIMLKNRTIKDNGSIIKCIDKSITSIVIPNTVKKITAYRFYNCNNLVSITIPNSVTFIGGYAFYGCSALTDLVLPVSPNIISWNCERVFYGCSSLTSFSITFSQIPEYAFGYCTSLNSVTLSNNVNFIGSSAFYNCSLLSSVTIQANTPPTLRSGVFSGASSNLVIYVPSESVETYKNALGWSSLASKIQAIPTWSLAI